MYFVTTTEETSAEELARLFRDNVWKLHGLPESIVLWLASAEFVVNNKPHTATKTSWPTIEEN